MMIFDAVVLFFFAFAGGLYALVVSKNKARQSQGLLVFGGSFLFSITVIHIIPELFTLREPSLPLGFMILGGFFFQQLLEYFTRGVEHGHWHEQVNSCSHATLSGISLMVALCVHSFLEGTILAYPSGVHLAHDHLSLMLGIALHKIPAALALMSLLCCQFQKHTIPLVLLLVFASASPLGLLMGHLITFKGWLGVPGLVMLSAFVAGNFLHISTTIFVEYSPKHEWSLKKLLTSLFAALLAMGTTLFSH